MKNKFNLTPKQVDDLIDFAFVLTLCSFLLYSFILVMESLYGC